MALDIKRRRFRIPGQTFQLIGTPEYFRLLVNPNSMGLVIEECSEYTKGAYQLSKVPQHKGSYEMTSKSLMDEITLCAGIGKSVSDVEPDKEAIAKVIEEFYMASQGA
jgi:hypothetical protein